MLELVFDSALLTAVTAQLPRGNKPAALALFIASAVLIARIVLLLIGKQHLA